MPSTLLYSYGAFLFTDKGRVGFCGYSCIEVQMMKDIIKDIVDMLSMKCLLTKLRCKIEGFLSFNI
jgi:hypothetical protein